MSHSRLANTLLGGMYRHLLKPLFFRVDPETVHERMIAFGKFLGNHSAERKLLSVCFSFSHPSLKQRLCGIDFENPVGLAAGFDKNAELARVFPLIGFGFAELGSVTGEPCEGNPRPRLWRLPESNSLVVYYGLKNDGCEVISTRLTGQTFSIPIGISIAMTNNAKNCDLESAIADYAKAYRVCGGLGSYITVNISCPNTFGGEPFTDPTRLDSLLSTLDPLDFGKPVFLKISPDLSEHEVRELVSCASHHRVDGFICSNITKNRRNAKIRELVVPEKGGLSGKVVEELANTLIQSVYRQTNGRFLIIGCGGVFSAEDAYTKIRLGAPLVQLITGMIYRGPQLINEINRGLVELLERDGYKNISEAVGVDSSKL